MWFLALGGHDLFILPRAITSSADGVCELGPDHILTWTRTGTAEDIIFDNVQMPDIQYRSVTAGIDVSAVLTNCRVSVSDSSVLTSFASRTSRTPTSQSC
jgi:hypothetical protein